MEKPEETRRLRPARRYRYTEHYKMVRRTLPDGTVKEVAEYIGKYLLPEHSAEVYRSARTSALFASVFSLLAAILLLTVNGFVVYEGGVYALVPAAAALFPGMYLLLGSLKLPAEDRELQVDTYRLAHERIRRSSMALVVLYALTLVLTVIFLATSGVKPGAADILYFILTAGTPVINVFLLRVMKSLKYN